MPEAALKNVFFSFFFFLRNLTFDVIQHLDGALKVVFNAFTKCYVSRLRMDCFKSLWVTFFSIIKLNLDFPYTIYLYICCFMFL